MQPDSSSAPSLGNACNRATDPKYPRTTKPLVVVSQRPVANIIVLEAGE